MINGDYQMYWQEAMRQIREEVGENEFAFWFSQMEYMGATDTEIGLGFPSSFYRDMVKSRYKTRIENKLKTITGKAVSLSFEIMTRPPARTPPVPDIHRATTPPVPDTHRATTPPVPDTHRATTPPVPDTHRVKQPHSQLRGDYTFNRYVIGENNNFATNAAKAISLNPGTTKYNPFLIYGGVGLGKTHLMQAVGNYIHRHNDRKIIYISAESFLNEFVDCIQKNYMPAFRNKYRFIDVLLIDDIQFLQDKAGIQNELFYIFNALYDTKKQIIFTCDRPVSELKQFSDRLRSRVGLGLTVDLQPPNYETRYAILKAKLQEHSVLIPEEVISLVAQSVATNIRDLEGALTTLVGYAELVGKPITIAVARQQLKGVLAAPAPVSTPHAPVELVIQAVAACFSFSPDDLRGAKRSRKIVEARQIAMYLTKEITEYTNTEIGQIFGGREHSTVMHACQRVEEQLRSNPQLEASIEKIKMDIAKNALG
ncbi:MAG: chromosomal replication initiator protein DnaA [Treponema sp.]|jgi:chromosomal replication initiator protein|nr:chromosomal replication initiator protein DnaA [Treponema sp.]